MCFPWAQRISRDELAAAVLSSYAVRASLSVFHCHNPAGASPSHRPLGSRVRLTQAPFLCPSHHVSALKSYNLCRAIDRMNSPSFLDPTPLLAD